MKISIVTINYNNCSGLVRTIESVLAQQMKPSSFVIIDGGSIDGSLNCIEKYSGHITYWKSEKDNGVYHAQNKGWLAVEADYYLFLNSGDTLLNTSSLAKLAASVTNKRQIVYGNLMIKPTDDNFWVKLYPKKLPSNYFDYETLPHPASLISKYWLHKENGYDETLEICSDWKFFRSVFYKSPGSFRHVDETISVFGLGGMSSKSGADKIIEYEKAMVKKQISHPKTLRRRFSNLLSRR